MSENKKKKTILLIDDDNFTHRMSRVLLESAGYEFLSAFEGSSGLEMLLEKQPDIVLLDYLMPDMDGHQVYQEIISNKTYASCTQIPIVIFTAANTEESIREKYFDLGVAAYLEKPFGSKELINVIENILSTNRLRMKNKQFLELTRRAKDFLENLIASSPDAILTTDVDGRINFSSSGAEEMFGYASAEMDGKLLANFCKCDASLPHIFERLNYEEKIHHIEMNFRAKSGKEIPVSFSFSLIKDQAETLIGYLGIAKDMSEIKRLEKELIEKERLAALMETTAAINHEINNPLTPILGNVQLLLADREKLDDYTQNKLEVIEKNAWRVYEIIKKLEQITQPIQTTYVGDVKMLDIENSN